MSVLGVIVVVVIGVLLVGVVYLGFFCNPEKEEREERARVGFRREMDLLNKRCQWANERPVSCSCGWSGKQREWQSGSYCPTCYTREKPSGFVDALVGSGTQLERTLNQAKQFLNRGG